MPGPRVRFVLAAILTFPAALPAQTSPFVDPDVERSLVEELSGDLAYETLRVTTPYHKLSGSPDYMAVAKIVMERAKAAGLADVRWIDQAMDEKPWWCRRAEAWLIEGAWDGAPETKLGSYAEVATSIADHSRPADVTADLVDVGPGDRAADYAGKDVAGKIVLASGNPSIVMEQAVWKRRAAGILSWASTRLNALADAPDQIAWLRVPVSDGPAGQKTTFAFVISARAGKSLSDRLRGQSADRIFSDGRPAPRRLRARIVVESEFGAEARTAMVEARIPGSDPALPEIVLTSHLQEEKFSANDNQSGVANMLEIGRTLARLTAEGRLPPPRRGVRFWWCDEIHSEYRYFADHPGEEKRVLANLNQDMVGARQSIGQRMQHFSRTPWSRPSYVSDVQESVFEMVVAGNNAFLPAWQAGSIPPGVAFSKPIFSRLGSREPFAGRAVPYFDSTDHLAFNDSWVGVPGTTLTNWPDENIHSSSDDLWQMDPTQLKRNAFVVAATAWWLATAGAPDAAAAASYVAARGAARIGEALSAGLERLGRRRPPRPEDFRAAADLLTTAFEKEREAVASAKALDSGAGEGEGDATDRAIRGGWSLLDQTTRGAKTALLAAWEAAGGAKNPDSSPSAAEERLKARIPAKSTATLSDWLALDRKIRRKREEEARARREAAETPAAESRAPKGRSPVKAAPAALPPDNDKGPRLSPLLEFETLNWIDGKTDAGTIARRVCAEALAAGRWYYGDATPEMVEAFLEREVRDGRVRW
ncbi:MAG TPA: M28 family peptidase [Thermoanaerobaculia bacterium]